MKRSLTNTQKAIAICNLQAFINKLKGTMLEKSVALCELKEANIRLTTDFHLPEHMTKVWMITSYVMTIMLALVATIYMA